MPFDRLPEHIHNPVTGDRIHFISSPMSGDGDTLSFRCWLPGHAPGAPVHSHAAMTETFVVEAGILEIDLGDGDIRQLAAGDSIRLGAGTRHGFRNPLATETRFLNVATPGHDLERFLRGIYGLAAAGEAGADGMPASPLALAAVLDGIDMTMAGLPRWFQRGAVAVLARLARLTGAAQRVRAVSATMASVAR